MHFTRVGGDLTTPTQVLHLKWTGANKEQRERENLVCHLYTYRTLEQMLLGEKGCGCLRDVIRRKSLRVALPHFVIKFLQISAVALCVKEGSLHASLLHPRTQHCQPGER